MGFYKDILFISVLFEDPVRCRKNRWNIINKRIMKGNMK